MLRKVSTLVILLTVAVIYSAEAKIWRLNNAPGIAADFTSFHAAATSASVNAGDTLYLEPTGIQYATNSITLSKRLIIIGAGYFLDPSNTTYPYNPGLSAATKFTQLGFLRMGPGSDGTKFLGITLDGSLYFNGSSNIQFEKIFLVNGGVYFESGTNNNVSFRKCFIQSNISHNGGNPNPALVITNLVLENNIFHGGYISFNRATGTGNIFRNNSMSAVFNTNVLANFYVANNIFGAFSNTDFLDCTIKNNLFQVNQTLPGTATANLVNINMADVYTGGNGAIDARYVLKAGSPAIGAGLTIGSVVTPDCGAYGATDPYKLSGIPNIPSIYTLTVPTSVPSGSATMNVTLSTRNNN